MTTRDSSWVLITGASSGFGAEFARQYGAQGHSLVLVARRLDRLQKLAESLRQQFRIDVVVEQVDFSDVAAVIQLHERLRERTIAIDILINNAGHGLQSPFLDGQLDAALLMMQPAPVVRAGIRTLQAGRISVVPGWANKAAVIFTWATPRRLHQAIFSRIMNG